MAAMIEQFDESTKAQPRGKGTELKRRLVDHLDVVKRTNDIVKVTQITNHHFRVNTLSPFKAADRVMPMYRITKSQFLHVEERLGELVINDQTRSN
ncbi:MAG TPA: hypothetical protein VM008_15930 [Phycisphaerae bacterium]|nr:hypothetical protein [Phycisphaerae bacterium]